MSVRKVPVHKGLGRSLVLPVLTVRYKSARRSARWFTGFLLSLLFAGQATADEQAATVQRWLSSMSHALHDQTYAGLLTYEYGGVLESMRVVHSVRDGVSRGSLERLNGPARQQTQGQIAADCVPVADQLLRGVLRPFGPDQGNLEQNYQLHILGGERIAGRSAQVVQIVPRDRYRHGLIIAIDEQSSLPLQTMVISHDKRVLERFQFVELQVGDQVNPAVLQDSLQASLQDSQQAADTAEQLNCSQGLVQALLPGQQNVVTGADASSPWLVDWMPSGFVLSRQQQSAAVGEMLSFTDGVSSFSVFVAAAEGSPLSAFESGRAQIGAVVAYIHPATFTDRTYVVTVVGDIPAQTAMRIATSVKPR